MQCCSDTVFYRTFCVSLLLIAFIFTVILTNVFIDIDSLIWGKRKVEKTDKKDITTYLPNAFVPLENKLLNDDYLEDFDESYRSKRSLESQKILFHINNPKIKNMLTNRLVDLLGELDAEETKKSIKETIKDDVQRNTEVNKMNKREKELQNDDMLHLAMHNILLQGILGHMDLNSVYKQVHLLVNKFDGNSEKTKGKDNTLLLEMKDTDVKKISELRKDHERKFFEELVKCKALKKQISESSLNKDHIIKGPHVLIKTSIDIATFGDDENKKNCTNDLEGIVMLNYNGKSVKIRDQNHISELEKNKIQRSNETDENKTNEMKKDLNYGDQEEHIRSKNKVQLISTSFLNNIVAEYLEKYKSSGASSVEVMENFENKRSKRHVRVKYDTDKEHTKKDEDELYVEIETHFNNKGMKGELKKKIMKNIIDKIKKVIHNETTKGSKQTPKTNKTSNHTITFDRDQFNLFRVLRRHSEPIISKSKPVMDPLPLFSEKTGNKWKQMYFGPGYLSASKAINSAEAGTVHIEYDKIANDGIPQRVQDPINNQISKESHENETDKVLNVGNLKLFVKNIEGSGLSIGFSQFTDEPPDIDSLKSFSGIDNIVSNYRQIDDVSGPSLEDNIAESIDDTAVNNNDHIIERRSIKKKSDYHSNEYRIIVENNNFLPYLKYKDVIYGPNVQSYNINKKNRTKDLIIDDNIFNQNLNPSEIFGLANLIDRKKRDAHLKTKRVSENKKYAFIINKLKKIFKKNVVNKKLFINKKRQKRDIEKIRIIATDIMPDLQKNSDENSFNDEVYGDRAVLREIHIPQIEHESRSNNPYEYIYPFNSEEIPLAYNIGHRSRHNALMSKYPHIFMEDVTKSKESEIVYKNPMFFANLLKNNREKDIKLVETYPENVPNTTMDVPALKVQELLKALSPEIPNTNYKLSIKIQPKNLTGENTGFKEIHTSINKSYNNNGLTYVSSVNVSEIHKIHKLNDTLENITSPSPIVHNIKEQQKTMYKLLTEHKESLDKQREIKSLESKSDIPKVDSKDFVEITLPLDPSYKLHLRKDDISRLISAAFTRLSKHDLITEAFRLNKTDFTTVESTTIIPKYLSSQKVSTVNKNDNLTNEILNKIDKNTQILKMFLYKITNEMNFGSARANVDSETEQMKENTNPNRNFYRNNDWRTKNEPHTNTDQNSSHIAIPFIYAYHQPYPEENKVQTPVSNIVYHGHIHPNSLTAEKEVKNEVAKVEPNEIDNRNKTRFFMEDLDFKIEPIVKKALVANKTHSAAV